MSVTVVDSVLRKSPVVFLRLAEIQNGELDVQVSSGGGDLFEGTLDYNIIKSRLTRAEQRFNSARIGSFAVTVSKFSECETTNSTRTLAEVGMRYSMNATTADGYQDCETATAVEESCLVLACPKAIAGTITALDTEKEKEMQLGRSWPLGAPAYKHAHLHKNLAADMGVVPGDTIFVSGQFHNTIRGALFNKAVDASAQTTVVNKDTIVHIMLTVDGIFDKVYGKFPEADTDKVVVSIDTFFDLLSENMRPDAAALAADLKAKDPNRFVSEVVFNLDPAERLNTYLGLQDFTLTGGSDFDKVQKTVVSFASAIMFDIGYSQVSATMAVLSAMRLYYFFSLFLGLILSVVIAILSLLSIMLIYSLLMINVETRTFEMGVLRMVGLRRLYLIELLVVQAMLFALPAWLFGTAGAQILLIFVLDYISTVIDVTLDLLIAWQSFLLSTLIGIGVPLLASIIPIRQALGMNVNDALDTSHSKTVAVKYNIERTSNPKIDFSLLAVGTGMAIFGFLIYYLFPLALLTLNLPLLLNIFFGLLLGMLFGAVILSLNAERLVESAILALFISWWNNRAVTTVVHKNLTAHRQRNRKTTIMFSLSLGFIIFVAVGSTVQIDSFSYLLQQRAGSSLYVEDSAYWDPTLFSYRTELEALCDKYPDVVAQYGWASHDLSDVCPLDRNHLTTMARIEDDPVAIVGISPMLLESTIPGFLNLDSQDQTSTLALGEQLYAPAGSYKGLMGAYYKKWLGFNMDDAHLVEIRNKAEGSKIHVFQSRALAFANSAPKFIMSKFVNALRQNYMVSFPRYVALSNGCFTSVMEIPMRYFMMRLAGGYDQARMDEFQKEIGVVITGSEWCKLMNVNDNVEQLEVATSVLGVFFGFVTIVAMFLSFFSLVSAMYTNIQEQVKEIGVMRAIGLSKDFLVKVYVIEAFIVVLSSSSLGVAIGTLVGWSMVAQRALFTQLPIPFAFPYAIIGAIFLAAVFFALGASFCPIRMLLRKNIVVILRMNA